MTISKRWTTVFILGLFFYALSGEALHFFNHFFPAVGLGFAILAILSLRKNRLAKHKFAIPFTIYVYAIIPEFIAYARKIIVGEKLHHAQWEDVFLLHKTLDDLLEKTELILPITALLLCISAVAYHKSKRTS